MTVTPNTMVAQIVAARSANGFKGDTLAYSTSTGDAVKVWHETHEIWDEFCFICGRCTDHSGEHTDRVEVSEYVLRTWDEMSKDGRTMLHFKEHSIRTFEAEGPLTYEAHVIATQWRTDY